MNIDSAAFNLPATVKAFKGKLKRNDFQRELIHTGLIKKSEIAFERLDKHNDRPKTNAAIAAMSAGADAPPILVIHASQTGFASELAERTAQALAQAGKPAVSIAIDRIDAGPS